MGGAAAALRAVLLNVGSPGPSQGSEGTGAGLARRAVPALFKRSLPGRRQAGPAGRVRGCHGARLMRSTPLPMLARKGGLRVGPRRFAVAFGEGLTAPLSVADAWASGRESVPTINPPPAGRTGKHC